MKSKRIIAFILALVMIASMFTFIGCKKDKNDPSSDNSQGGNNVVVDEENETTIYVKEKYGNNDFNGYDFRILSIDQGGHMYRVIDETTANEIWYEEDDADVYQHAIFTRNLLVSDLLDIKITPVWGGETNEVPELAKTLVKSGGDEFDMMVASLNKSMSLGIEGYMYNLYDINTLDMSEDWWDQDLISTYTYKKNKIFAIVGDYTVFDDYAVPVVFYNKNVMDNYNLSDPADLVDAGTWTVEAMMKMAESATQDTSGDGKIDINDTWGYTDNNHVLVHLLEGCDTYITVVDEEGVPQVNCTTEDFVNTVQFLFNTVALSTAVGSFNNDDCVDMMLEDRSLFYYELLGAINQFRDMESVFSLLPLPKKDESQKDYSSIINTVWSTAVTVPITNKNMEQTGTILNVLGGLSTDTVNKALHETILGPKLFREKRTVSMLQYALEAKAYDWAKEMSWASTIYNILREQFDDKTFTLASALQSKVKVLQKSLKLFLATVK